MKRRKGSDEERKNCVCTYNPRRREGTHESLYSHLLLLVTSCMTQSPLSIQIFRSWDYVTKEVMSYLPAKISFKRTCAESEE